MPFTTVHAFKDIDGEIPVDKTLGKLKKKNKRACAKAIARIRLLEKYGSDLRRPTSDSLRDGIHEMRMRVGTVQPRILYCFFGKNAVVLSHVIVKEGDVPEEDIELALKRKRLVEKDAAKYLAAWDIKVWE